jgi:predicted  nucleic acid-binding Zn-ribbon protein
VPPPPAGSNAEIANLLQSIKDEMRKDIASLNTAVAKLSGDVAGVKNQVVDLRLELREFKDESQRYRLHDAAKVSSMTSSRSHC